jgi:hypothetical protein
LGRSLGQVSTGTLYDDGLNGFNQCPGDGPDAHFHWQAPRDGRYVFRTDGSTFDAVLFLKRGAVCGDLRGGLCNDDYYELQSLLAIDLQEGDSVWAVVDSYTVDAGDYVLAIQDEGACPGASVGSSVGDGVFVAESFRYDSVVLRPGGVDQCGGGPLGFTVEWEAPAAGTYQFAVRGQFRAFDPVVAVRFGCGAMPTACDNDGGPGRVAAETSVFVEAGTRVIIEIGAADADQGTASVGRVQLDIELVD